MKKIVLFSILSLIVLSGCQQSNQKAASDITRKDRLLANENMRLEQALAQCRQELADKNAEIEKMEQERLKTAEDTNKMMEFLMNEVPTELMTEVKRLTEENQKLTAEIERLKAQ